MLRLTAALRHLAFRARAALWRLLSAIDRRFFHDGYDGRRVLNDLSRAVRQLASQPDRLLAYVSHEVREALHPRALAIFVAPDTCTRLVPIDGPPGGCCELAWGREASRRFVRFVDERHQPADIDERPSATRRANGSPILGAHLAASASGEPTTLDLHPLGAPPVKRSRRQPDSAPASHTPAGDVDRTTPCSDESTLLSEFGAGLAVPLVTTGRVLGFMLLGPKPSGRPYTCEDRELLLAVAGQVAIALEYAQLIGQAAEQAALRREIQIAHQVQARLFPHERPSLRSLRYSGVCRAARGVAGDFYDFLELAPGRLGIAVADIAGKGLPAALLMASLQALLRSHAPTYGGALEDLARELNRHMVETTDEGRFASLFFGVFDDDTRTLRYVNAGHLPPIVLRRDCHGEMSLRRLEAGGIVLGLFHDQTYVQACARLEPGDRLLVFSDGVTEAADPSGQMFGEQRLVSAALKFDEPNVERLPEYILREVDRFVGPSSARDDITIIAAEVA